MTGTSVAPPARLLPFHNTSRRWRITKVVIWLAGFALVLGLLELMAVDVLGWPDPRLGPDDAGAAPDR